LQVIDKLAYNVKIGLVFMNTTRVEQYLSSVINFQKCYPMFPENKYHLLRSVIHNDDIHKNPEA